MTTQTGWRWGVPVVAAVAGMLFVTTARTAQGTDLRSDQHTDLAGLVTAEQDRYEQRLAQVGTLRAEVSRLLAQADDPEAVQLSSQVDQLAPAAGMRAVRGEGLTVTLTDAPVPPDGIPDGYGPNDYVVHQQDLQAVVNAMWAGGAEAVEVMDQRLVSTSAVRCVGNTLILQGRVYSPPYTVTAVGPVPAMLRALEADPTMRLYREWVDLVGLGYQVTQHRSILVPGFDGDVDVSKAELTG